MDSCAKHSPFSTVRFGSAAASFARWIEKEADLLRRAVAIGRAEIAAGRGNVPETKESIRQLECERSALLARLARHPFSRGILDSGPVEAKRTLARACRTLQSATATAPQSAGVDDRAARLDAIQSRLSAYRRPATTSTSTPPARPRRKVRFDRVADIRRRQRRWNWDRDHADEIRRLRVYWRAIKMSEADQQAKIELMFLKSCR